MSMPGASGPSSPRFSSSRASITTRLPPAESPIRCTRSKRGSRARRWARAESRERSAAGLLLLDSFGIDCAMESGWYAANQKPLVAIGNASTRFVNNWMVKGAVTHFVTLEQAVLEVAAADPILKGYCELELLSDWSELARVLERAAGAR